MNTPESNNTGWMKLNPSVCTYWKVKGIVTILPITFFFTFSIMFYSIEVFALVLMVIVLLGGALVILWATLFYERYFYLVGDDGVYINRGIWFKNSRTIPYERIQHISVTRGPIMILFGISDINIFTAGTGSLGSSAASRGLFGAEGFIPGLIDPEPLREEIWRRVKIAKSGSGLGDELFTAEADAATPPSPQQEDAVLEELRKIREILERSSEKQDTDHESRT